MTNQSSKTGRGNFHESCADIPNQSELPAYPTCVPNNESSWDHKLILHSTRESGLKKYNTCVKCLILQDFSCFERRHTVHLMTLSSKILLRQCDNRDPIVATIVTMTTTVTMENLERKT